MNRSKLTGGVINQSAPTAWKSFRPPSEIPTLPGYGSTGGHTVGTGKSDLSRKYLGPVNHELGDSRTGEVTFFAHQEKTLTSFYIISFMDYLIGSPEFSHFMLSKILPLLYTESAQFRYIHYHVDPAFASLHTPKANTPYHTYSKRSEFTEIQYWRTAMVMDRDFLGTAAGEQLYIAQIWNMKLSIEKAMIVYGIRGMIDRKTYESFEGFLLRDPSLINGSYDELVNTQRDLTFIFNKEPNAIALITGRTQPAQTSAGVKYTGLILQKDLAIFSVLGNPLNTIYAGVGDEFKENLKKGGENMRKTGSVENIYPLDGIKVGKNPNDVLYPLARYMRYFTYATASPYTSDYGDCTSPPQYKSLHSNTAVIDMENGSNGEWKLFSPLCALKYSGIFSGNEYSMQVKDFVRNISRSKENSINNGYVGEWFVSYDRKFGHKLVEALGDMQEEAYPDQAYNQFATIGAQQLRHGLTSDEQFAIDDGIDLMETLNKIPEFSDEATAWTMAVVYQNDYNGDYIQILPGNEFGGTSEIPIFVSKDDDVPEGFDMVNGKHYLAISNPEGEIEPMVRVDFSAFDTARLGRALEQYNADTGAEFGFNVNTPFDGRPKEGVYFMPAKKAHLFFFRKAYGIEEDTVNTNVNYYGLFKKYIGSSNLILRTLPWGCGNIPMMQTIAAKGIASSRHGFEKNIMNRIVNFVKAFKKLKDRAQSMFIGPGFNGNIVPWYFASSINNSKENERTVFGMLTLTGLQFSTYAKKPSVYESKTTEDGETVVTEKRKENREDLGNTFIGGTPFAWFDDNDASLDALEILNNDIIPWDDKAGGKLISNSRRTIEEYSKAFIRLAWDAYKKEYLKRNPDAKNDIEAIDRDMDMATPKNPLAFFLNKEVINEKFTGTNGIALENKKPGQIRLPGVNLLDHLTTYLKTNGKNTSGLKGRKIRFMSPEWIEAWKRDPPRAREYERQTSSIAEKYGSMDPGYKFDYARGKSGRRAKIRAREHAALSSQYIVTRLTFDRDAFTRYASDMFIKIKSTPDGRVGTQRARDIFRSIAVAPMNPVITTNPLGLLNVENQEEFPNARPTEGVESLESDKNIMKLVLMDYYKARAVRHDHTQQSIASQLPTRMPNKNRKPNTKEFSPLESSVDKKTGQVLWETKAVLMKGAKPSKEHMTPSEINVIEGTFGMRNPSSEIVGDYDPKATSTDVHPNMDKRYRNAFSMFHDRFARMAAILFVTSPARLDVAEKLYKNNLPLWCDGMMIRSPTYRSSSIILTEQDGKVGSTVYGLLDFFWNFNPNERRVYGYFHAAFAPVIAKPMSYSIFLDVFCTAYIGGEGLDPIIPKASNSYNPFSKRNKTDGSAFYLSVPIMSTKDIHSFFDIRGKYEQNSTAMRFLPRGGKKSKQYPFQGFRFFDHCWKQSNMLRNLEKRDEFAFGAETVVTPGALVFKSGQRRYNISTREFSTEITATDPFGPNGTYTGCKAHRVKGLLKKPLKDFVDIANAMVRECRVN